MQWDFHLEISIVYVQDKHEAMFLAGIYLIS